MDKYAKLIIEKLQGGKALAKQALKEDSDDNEESSSSSGCDSVGSDNW